ncbi:MAG: PKD domain-containing protein [Bacteroidota bacterium]
MMKIRIKYIFCTLLIIFISVFIISGVTAQSGCLNADFSMGNFSYWTGSTGMNSGGDYSSVIPGIVQGTTNSGPFDNGQQTIINAPGTDPNTGNALSVLPPGGSSCCRLGNANYNYHAERLSYTLAVTASNCIFTYQYAVVLEDPSHPSNEQPKFTIYVKDASGNVVDPICGIYEVSAAASIPGFNNYGSVRWKNWTTVGIDLSPWIGQNITIEFTTYDCAQGGHYGYAYIACSCGALQLAQQCVGTSSVITAPPGFSTYSWSVGGTGQSVTISNPVNGTVVSCVCTSVQGCSVTLYATINITPVSFTTNSPTICPGATAILTASPGTYNYTWSTSQTGSSISVSPTSTTTYTVSAADPGGGCSSSLPVVVNVYPAPVANAGNDVSTCIGGTVTLTASGGVSYSWSNSATTATTSVTPTGVTTYTVTVTSADGCTDADDITVSISSAIANAGTDQIICIGQNANLTAFGGVSYLWSNSAPTQSTNVSPAATSVYTVTVTDASGCTGVDDVLVTVNNLPPALAGPDQAICSGNSTNLNASGGITYFWSPATYLNNPAIFNPDANPLNTTTYSVTVTDANGCSAADNMVLTVNPLPNANAGADQTICVGSSANLNAIGGSTYIWSPATWLTNANIQNPVATPADTITYVVNITDANGCTGNDNITVNVNPIPTSAFTLTSPVCAGFNSTITYTGTASAAALYSWDFDGGTVSGTGQGPYFVSWNTPGTYNISLTVTENNCTSPVTSLPQIVGQVTASLAVTDSISCFGSSDGEVTVTAIGQPAYSYSWSNSQVGITATGLAANTLYNVTVTDSYGCTTSQGITLTQPQPLIMIFYTQDVSCFNGNNGYAAALVSGGTTSYQYTWSAPGIGNVSSTSTLYAGTYTLSVTDLHGCTIDTTFTISEPPLLTYSYVTDSVNCFSGTDGSIIITPNGGNPPYSFDWNPGVSTGPVANNLSFGTYYVTISDNNNCDTSALITINQPPQIVLNTSGDVTICLGQTTTISASASGGTGSYIFTWIGLGTGSSYNVNPTSTTTYTVSITDANGCTAAPQILTVTVNPPISVSVIANPTSLCLGESAQLTATANGGNGNYTYTWGAGIGVSGSTIIVTPSGTTMYPVTVTDNCGSPAGVDSVEIIVYPLPVVQFISDTIRGCEPLVVNFTDLSTPAIGSWLWDFGDPLSGPDNTSTLQNPTHVYSSAGTYTVTLSVVTTNGCSGSYTHQNMIEVYITPIANFTMHPPTGSTQDPAINFYDLSTNAYYWDWNFGEPSSTSNTSTETNPQHSYESSDTFTITLIVTSMYGCTDTAVQDVLITQDFSLFVPNAFTPNNDGDNDGFSAEGTGVDLNSFEMYIYDRWGELVFQTNDFYEAWDGRVMHGEKIAPIAVYSWLIYVKDENGEPYSFIGRVTLVR